MSELTSLYTTFLFFLQNILFDRQIIYNILYNNLPFA